MILLATFGCRRAGPEVVPVRGKITFGGGAWPRPGILYFVATKASVDNAQRPATGEFDADGTLTVTTFKKGDGLLPGAYGIGVECWEVPPQFGSPTAAKSYVPSRYGSATTSGFTVNVEAGQGVVELNLDVPKANK